MRVTIPSRPITRRRELFASMHHQTSGRTGLGIALAAITMLTWATLPVALSAMLRELDPLTLTWFRFLASALVLGAILAARGSLPKLSLLSAREWVMLGLATLFLAVNYLLFLVGLSMTTPANTQVVMQLSPLMFSLGGIAIFGERFNRRQWLGFFVLIGGLALFCSDQLLAFVEVGPRHLLGYAAIVGAALTWSISSLIQKRLLVVFRSQALLLCIYVGCALCYTPLATPARIAALPEWSIPVLIYCALNTLVAYGAFSASLENVEASRAGAVIALSPVATFGFIALTHAWLPGAIPPEHYSIGMLAGAAVVVVGSVVTARG